MTSREEVVSNLSRALGQYQPAMRYYPGFLGESDAADAPVLTARENYIWVRYPYSNTPAVPVLCVAANVPLIAGYRVTVGKLPWMTQDQVLWPGDFRVDGVSPTDAAMQSGTTAGYSPVAGRAINYQYLGLDPIYINLRQWTPLGVYPLDNASMSIRIMDGQIPRPGGTIFVYSQVVDLTSHVPVSGARYALVSIDSTGAVVITDGAVNAGGFAALTAADIPATPAGNWRSAAVVLYSGQTALVETNAEIDFYDLRYPEEKTALSQPLTNTHIFVGNASNVATDVAMSQDATIANTGALTLATVNSNVGAFTNANITVNGKGLITAASSGTTGHTIQDEGVALTTRANLNFVGAGVTATDDSANNATKVTIPLAPINVYNETATANGVNTIYYLANYAAPGTIRVYINGIRQPASDDVAATDVVQFTTAPDLGALLMFDYEMELT